MKRIILFGPPGAGKGTFAGVIKKFLPNIIHISTGDIFRENIQKETPLGVNAKKYIDKGELVPDSVVIALVEDRLTREDVQQNGYILDGFPRTIDQARALDKFTQPDMFILLDPPRDILMKRILGRFSCSRCAKIYNKFFLKPKVFDGNEGICDKCGSKVVFSQRSDDNEETLRKRFAGYDREAEPIIEFYEQKEICKRVKAPGVLELTDKEIKKLIEIELKRICVAVPIKGSDSEQNKVILKKAVGTYPEMIELRLDYIEEPEKLSQNFIESLLSYIPENLPVVCTFRALSEGGQANVTEDQRAEILRNILNANPKYLDIELNSNDELLREVVSLALSNNVRLIFSHHDFEKTPSFEDCVEMIKSFETHLNKDLSIGAVSIRKFPYKLIFTAKNVSDNLVPIQICQFMNEKRKRIISFCMGELGMYSRIETIRFGSFFTFASIEEKTAPGQMSVETLRKFYEIIYE